MHERADIKPTQNHAPTGEPPTDGSWMSRHPIASTCGLVLTGASIALAAAALREKPVDISTGDLLQRSQQLGGTITTPAQPVRLYDHAIRISGPALCVYENRDANFISTSLYRAVLTFDGMGSTGPNVLVEIRGSQAHQLKQGEHYQVTITGSNSFLLGNGEVSLVGFTLESVAPAPAGMK